MFNSIWKRRAASRFVIAKEERIYRSWVHYKSRDPKLPCMSLQNGGFAIVNPDSLDDLKQFFNKQEDKLKSKFEKADFSEMRIISLEELLHGRVK